MKDQSNKQFWQRMAKLYAPFMRSSGPLYEEIARHCRPYLAKDMCVLELACGSGQLTFRLAESVRCWEATDFSEKMIAEAKKRSVSPNLTFAVRDATALPYPDESFDAVLIANALHIMPEPDKALLEIHRVLNPGGILMAPTFIWGTDARQQISEKLMALGGFRVLHRWSTGAFTDYVQQRGFTVLEQNAMGGSIRPLCCLIARKT
ncbi:MAG TPA: class I SAM-dependent methyltransferase [Syntrophomonas sp.]|nr:class I SAM-dependent methyltransferase [Syntrophomonas sp.]